MFTHIKRIKKTYVINVHSRWHLAQSEAGLHVYGSADNHRLYLFSLTYNTKCQKSSESVHDEISVYHLKNSIQYQSH